MKGYKLIKVSKEFTMPSLSSVTSFYVPSGAEVSRAARLAMENIDRQLKKLPPMKKPASAADNFPGIYDDANAFKVHVLGQRDPNHKAVLKYLDTARAINVYKNAG